ncbi:DUF4166 domain-containing protein [Phyllobacterium sp. SB3]|uniref:DUF4166 domain-containing protein n=1 Tax=Phyllobacterium sp. SB3 TaxID=3156073 RepID=UPI0032AEDDA4
MNSKELFQRITGTSWANLPKEIRDLHNTSRASGMASVERGHGFLARCIAFFAGFPENLPNTPVTVDFIKTGNDEIWLRDFGGDRFSSRQLAGQGRYHGLLCERFGPITFAMALECTDQRLTLRMRHWDFFGFPLPMFLCPVSNSYEYVDDGRMHFNVEISHPLAGLIVHYRGWLEREN